MTTENEVVQGPYFYCVTAQKPTAVESLVAGNFTNKDGKDTRNLIISKSTRIEIHDVKSEGLVLFMEVPINGRIAVMKLFRPKNFKKDLLFIVTESYNFCVLEYDEQSDDITTRAHGNAKDTVGYPADSGIIGIIDPECRMIGLRIYNGVLKIIPVNQNTGELSEAFNVRLEEHQILDMNFLYGPTKPTIMVLYQDVSETHNVKTYEMNLREKELQQGPWQQENIELGSSMLIPVPNPIGGCLIIGEQTITHHNGSKYISIPMNNTIITCYCKVDDDGHRYLLSDFLGRMYILRLKKKKEIKLELEVLGETPTPSSLCYVDNNHVYVGSKLGDSCLVKLLPRKSEDGSFLNVVETFSNLGPIVDSCVLDYDGLGQDQIITCSGGGKDGSLKVIMNGIGINRIEEIELEGVTDLWALKSNKTNELDDVLILSFVCETRVLMVKEEFEGLDPGDITGFNCNLHSIFCGSVLIDTIVQVTQESVRFINSNFQLIKEWVPIEGATITKAACTESQLLVALGGGTLAYLDLETWESTIQKVKHEVACITIMPLKEGEKKSVHCAFGLWTEFSMNVLSLPDLKEVVMEMLDGEFIPRSIIFTNFGEQDYLLCSLGDGSLVHCTYQNKKLMDKKKIVIGTRPVELRPFISDGKHCVFASSDRPCVIFCLNKKIVCSTVNLKDVHHMCPLNTTLFPNSLALIVDKTLSIATIDNVQKLHIRSIPVGEMPRRITHMPESRAFAVVTVKEVIEKNYGVTESSYIRLFDDQTFQLLSSFDLDRFEQGCSIRAVKFPNLFSSSVFVVGTAYAYPQDDEPQKGRLIVLSVENGELQVIAKCEVPGAVYCIESFGDHFVAGISGKISMHTLEHGEQGYTIKQEDSYAKFILTLQLRAHDDYVLAANLFRSISLLKYNKLTKSLEEVASDPESKYTTQIAMLNDRCFLVSDHCYNFYAMKRKDDSNSKDCLEACGEFHIGEYVNVITHGSLVMKDMYEKRDAIRGSLIYGSASGSVGVIAILNREQFVFLNEVQSRARKVVKGIGGFGHSEWRSYQNERRTVESWNFIDGDLIESLLELQPTLITKLCKGLTKEENGQDKPVSSDELMRFVRELSLIH